VSAIDWGVGVAAGRTHLGCRSAFAFERDLEVGDGSAGRRRRAPCSCEAQLRGLMGPAGPSDGFLAATTRSSER
jgi:hypothetical protein